MVMNPNETMAYDSQAPLMEMTHGGVDALGAAPFDFSTNSNACGPCLMVWERVQQADSSRYPDPTYLHLRRALAQWHGVALECVVLGGSASELIHRLHVWARLNGAVGAIVPIPAYGDYARQALALGLPLHRRPVQIDSNVRVEDECGSPFPAQQGRMLEWVCSPSSPHGADDARWLQWQAEETVDHATDHAALWRVRDAAYAPLVLVDEAQTWRAKALQRHATCWQLFSPNKSLGLTGIRAAYALAPRAPEGRLQRQQWHQQLQAMQALSPSWPVGAHGVAMLQAWVDEEVQQWLHHTRLQLREWKQQQIAAMQALGWWVPETSITNYFVVQPLSATQSMPLGDLDKALMARLNALRRHGVKLRETASMGLPGHVRVSVQPPQAQAALVHAWHMTETSS